MKWKKIYNYYAATSGFMLVLLAIMGLLVIYPAWNKIVAIKNEITTEKNNLEKKLDMGLNSKKIKADLQNVENKLAILDTIFIPQGDELSLLSSIENLAATSNVEVAIKPDFTGINMGNSIIRTPLSISATGRFDDLLSFLNSLDGTDYILIINQISMAKISEEKMSLGIAGEVYIKTDKTAYAGR